MTSTASAPLRSLPATPAPVAAAPACLVEVEAWLAEVTPILAALRLVPSGPSSGQQRWLVRVADDAHRALDLLEAECLEAEVAGEPTDGAEWLHTRVAATLAAGRSLLVSSPVAA